jgi:hypothetical protein
LGIDTRILLIVWSSIVLQLINQFPYQVKQLDDKLLLVEIFLIDTRVNFQCENLAKAKAALTAAKTNGKEETHGLLSSTHSGQDEW